MDLAIERLTIEEHNGKKIIFVNYNGLKEAGMIELVNRHQQLALETGFPFIADFQNTYVTTGYMKHARRFVEATQLTVNKGALLGVDAVKSMILKGVLILYRVNYQPFDNKAQAVAFLTGENPVQG
jgi:hypothetical protein